MQWIEKEIEDQFTCEGFNVERKGEKKMSL